jgi:site-specific recombinase XerC
MGMSLERQALVRVGKNWSKGSLTREKLLSNVQEFSRFVAAKFGLEKIDNLKPKMIEAFAKDLHEKKLAPATMAGKMTAVREIAAAIGKQNIVARDNKAYGIERIRINPQAINHDKLSEIREMLQDRATNGDKIAKMSLAADRLREAFGLRAKESLMSRNILQRDGRQYLVVEGAKGGRPRELEVKTDAQLKAVQFVDETSRSLGSGTGRIIPPNMSLKQAYDAQRNLWTKLGGTRKTGANMHGERHAKARELKTQGTPKGDIMNFLGHGEERSPAAYGV